MTRHEMQPYKLETHLERDIEDALNAKAKEGYELVQAIPTPHLGPYKWMLIFKQPPENQTSQN